MRHTARILILAVAATALSGCWIVRYEHGLQDWSHETIHPGGVGKHRIEHARVWDIDRRYREKGTEYRLAEVLSGSQLQGKRIGEAIGAIAEHHGTQVHRHSRWDNRFPHQDVGGKDIVLKARYGPVDDSMSWLILQNSIEMASPNGVKASLRLGWPWQRALIYIYAHRTGKYDVLNKEQTRGQGTGSTLPVPEVGGATGLDAETQALISQGASGL